MITHDQLNDGILEFAQTLSSGPLGLALYLPELSASPMRCFENVLRKVTQEGGQIQFGWTFLHRFSPGKGDYLIATHHAVWYEPTGQLIDVTPMHEEEKHRPIAPSGEVLFLVDDLAKPVRMGIVVAPLPLRYFPLAKTRELMVYLENLQRDEERQCAELYKRPLT